MYYRLFIVKTKDKFNQRTKMRPIDESIVHIRHKVNPIRGK
jgi:hypothetical protein